MKVTIYELLGMVKDSKAPKKFIYDNQLFILDEEDNVYRSHLGNRFGAMYQLDIKLNDKVEILEEEKKIPKRVLNAEVFDIPKLNNMELSNIVLTNKEDIKIIKDTLNKVLDYLKNKGE